jgi:hypothetical protein
MAWVCLGKKEGYFLYAAEGYFNKEGKFVWPGIKQNLREGVTGNK